MCIHVSWSETCTFDAGYHPPPKYPPLPAQATSPHLLAYIGGGRKLKIYTIPIYEQSAVRVRYVHAEICTYAYIGRTVGRGTSNETAVYSVEVYRTAAPLTAAALIFDWRRKNRWWGEPKEEGGGEGT